MVAFGAPVQSAHPRRAGTESGPSAIRAASCDVLQTWLSSPSRAAIDLSTGTARRLRDLGTSVDIGDLDCGGPVSTASIASVAQATAAIIEASGFPVLLGGDHRVFEGLVRGVHDLSTSPGNPAGPPLETLLVSFLFPTRLRCPQRSTPKRCRLRLLRQPATATVRCFALVSTDCNPRRPGRCWIGSVEISSRLTSCTKALSRRSQRSMRFWDSINHWFAASILNASIRAMRQARLRSMSVVRHRSS